MFECCCCVVCVYCPQAVAAKNGIGPTMARFTIHRHCCDEYYGTTAAYKTKEEEPVPCHLITCPYY
eukprot:Nitzschia sp. Nitz4//scaffold2_size372955//230128//230404//NITZ4_000441-RA/size372955-exonerate_est2genome-gene-0.214-mRNA-1//-1//CDS//3329546832//2119//frame0